MTDATFEIIDDGPITTKSAEPNNLLSPNLFACQGKPTKFDQTGILDENIHIRQNIAKSILTQNTKVLNDPELLSIVLKSLADNDKSLLSAAKLQVEESGNKSQEQLVKAIVQQTIASAEQNRKQYMLGGSQVIENIGAPEFELPEPSREIQDFELRIGTEVLSDKEVMDTIKMTEGNTGNNEDD